MIPLKLGLIGANGDELPLKLDGAQVSDGLIEVTDREQVFTFRDVPSPPTPSLLRGFSAPVRITTGLDAGRIEFLMTHDSDPFNRWQAAQTYATNLLTAAARDGDGSEHMRRRRRRASRAGPRRHRERCGRCSRPIAPSSSSFRANPISRASLAAMSIPTPCTASRESLRAQIGNATTRDLGRALRDASRRAGAYSPDAASAGLRALAERHARPPRRDRSGRRDRARRTALPRGDQHDGRHRGPLHPVAAARGPSGEAALEHFYARWQDEPLVLDKWFAVQARAARPDSVETVQGAPLPPEILAEEPQSHPRADRKLHPFQSDRLQPRRRGRLPPSRRPGARNRPVQPARGGAAAWAPSRVGASSNRSARPTPRRRSKAWRPGPCPPTATRSSARPWAEPKELAATSTGY